MSIIYRSNTIVLNFDLFMKKIYSPSKSEVYYS